MKVINNLIIDFVVGDKNHWKKKLNNSIIQLGNIINYHTFLKNNSNMTRNFKRFYFINKKYFKGILL